MLFRHSPPVLFRKVLLKGIIIIQYIVELDAECSIEETAPTFINSSFFPI